MRCSRVPDLSDLLDEEAALIAAEVTELMVELHPEMFEAFRRKLRNPEKTPEQWCTDDTIHHLRNLSAALDTSSDEFIEYRQWLTGMLAARGVLTEDIDRNFAAIASVLERRYGTQAKEAVEILSVSTGAR